jgi:peptide deformylase
MAVHPIVTYPDARLRQVASTVETFDAVLGDLCADLDDTMRAAPGIGITAPHIGVGLRVMAVALDDQPAQFFINPRIISASSELTRYAEGSISMLGVTEEIERPARIQVAYQDRQGSDQVIDADGLMAVCLQHEIDQLDGIFWLQRLSRLRRERVLKRFEKVRD